MSLSRTVGEVTVGIEHLWPLAVFPVAVAALAWLILRGEGGPRSASTRDRRLLFASRVLVVALLVAGAAGPYTVVTRETPGEPRVTLLADESDSMGVYPDVADDLVSDVEAAGVPVRRVTVATGDDSRVGEALTVNLRENGTVVLLSDGRVTGGKGLEVAAEEAARLNATVSVVEPEPDRTERAVSIAGPDTASAGIETEFTVSLSGVGDVGGPVTVSVDGERVASDRLDQDGVLRVTHTFETVGPHRVTARVEGSDVYDRNDVFYKRVQVVEKPDLLYVSQGEYRLREYLATLYDVTNASSVPDTLDGYAAVVIQDTPAPAVGNVSALQEHVVGGGGLVVVGGENAYGNGGYADSPLSSLLPVRVGNATGGRANVVLLIDISGSVREGLSTQKAIALDTLSQLGDRTRVGVVAFGAEPYRIADLQRLEGNRERIADRIRRLETARGTNIAFGLRGAGELLGDRGGTVILFSDGFDDVGPAVAAAGELRARGTRVLAVGAAERVVADNLRRIAAAGDGSYFRAGETSRLRLLFGGGSRQFRGQNLTVVTRGTAITSGVTLTATLDRANDVAVKTGADYQVATADGLPAIVSWRFGLGRVVSITAYDDAGGLDGLLAEPDSLVVTKSVNYAVGDPRRTQTGVIDVGDARVGRETELTYRGERRPEAPNVTLRRIGDELYRGEFTPRRAGYATVLNATYAANYPAEYARFGPSPAVSALVDATGGRSFAPDQGAAVASLARERANRVRTVRRTWSWAALLAALVVFAVEVIARRVQVYRGRTSLESGLR
jgi:Mg-chelatase subunit ChlD